MAVAGSVLERKYTTELEERTTLNDALKTADERHNAGIGAAYARLINEGSTVNDVIRRDFTQMRRATVEVKREEKPYLVENARADADIFRADSPIYRKAEQVEVTAEATTPIEEEENEDLRPTPTTIQYRTEGLAKNQPEGKIKNKSSKLSGLTKRDKIIIAVAVSVIIALFALIIVNSAVLTNLHASVDGLQTELTQVQIDYTNAMQESNTYFEEQNIYQQVSDFATNMGMILK